MDWNKTLSAMTQAVLDSRRKKITVKDVSVETRVIVAKADYFKGYEVWFYEPSITQERPF